MADPHVDGRMPALNRLLAARPFVALGSMAYSLYLWHWPLLIFWLAYSGDTKANFVEGAVVLLVSGVLAWLTTKYVEDPLRLRGDGGTQARGRRPAADPAAPADDRAGLDRDAARRRADRDVVHVARAPDHPAGQRQRTVDALVAGLSRRPRAAQRRQGAQAADAPHRARGQGRDSRNDRRRLHQRLRRRRRHQLHLRRPVRHPDHRARRRVTRGALDHRARSRWAACTASRWSPT